MQDAISLAKKETEWTDIATQTKILDLLMKVDAAKANAQVQSLDFFFFPSSSFGLGVGVPNLHFRAHDRF